MTEIIYCPDCKQDYIITKLGVRIVGSVLEEVERNYSGCGVDIYQCPKCKHIFQISYRVDEVKRLEEWEIKND